MNYRIAVIAALGALLAAPAWAQKSQTDHSAHHGGAQAAQADLVEGEVRKVDKDARKITLKHGPIPSLVMPAMTMVFQVKDEAMLGKVKAGDKVKFEAQKVGGAYIVTSIERATK